MRNVAAKRYAPRLYACAPLNKELPTIDTCDVPWGCAAVMVLLAGGRGGPMKERRNAGRNLTAGNFIRGYSPARPSSSILSRSGLLGQGQW
jgi:hypothetical protein